MQSAIFRPEMAKVPASIGNELTEQPVLDGIGLHHCVIFIVKCIHDDNRSKNLLLVNRGGKRDVPEYRRLYERALSSLHQDHTTNHAETGT
jgi:hypothetical protein